MKSKLFLTVLLLAAITTIGVSQEGPFQPDNRFAIGAEKRKAEDERISKLLPPVQSLVGVKGVRVLIKDLTEGAKSAGLTKEQLQTDVELKLRLAGIKVNSDKEWRVSEGHVFLAIIINHVSDDYSFPYSINLGLGQDVYLARKPHRRCGFITTWDKGHLGRCSSSKFAKTIRDTLKDQTDEFINDYLTANPKK